MTYGGIVQPSPTRLGLGDGGRGKNQLLISFATAFGNWRRRNHIPLKKIAFDLGVSISTVSSWELGERFPGGFNLNMLVEYTGLPPCKLFCIMADKCIPADCLLAINRECAGTLGSRHRNLPGRRPAPSSA